jgi:riboflavin synthase
VFTGIVETTAPVLERTDARLTLVRPAVFDIYKGCSIAVNGVCLTLVEFDADRMVFDVVGETWRRTNLGDLLVGNTVNLERAMKAHGRFEGHIVQGHVEDVAIMEEWKDDGQWKQLTVRVPDRLTLSIVEKGSIALDGMSLTVAKIDGDLLTVALIPHTLEITTIGLRQPGDRINVETDILAHYVRKQPHA